MSKKILLIEDDSDQRLILKLLLKKAGFEVEAIGSGEDALPLLKDSSYKAIVCDCKMPGITGLDVLRHERAASGPSRPFILLTAGDKDAVPESPFEPDWVLAKNEAQTQLVAKLNELMALIAE